LELYAEAMSHLGRRAVWAVHGRDATGEQGFDELSACGFSAVVALRNGVSERFSIDPYALGFPRNPRIAGLTGGDAEQNARRILDILSGGEQGVAKDMILLNAAAAIHLAGFGQGLREAVDLCRESIASGSALHALESLQEASRSASA
jgi:anthranilate phosphoribosyltransferase